jgi:diacylglycerol kinase (ATP)
MTEKKLFIINPISGKSIDRKAITKFTSELKTNPNYTLVQTESHGHATQLAIEGKSNYHTIVAVGGDGTINEVATGLMGSDVNLGIIPLGSGNGLANHLGIPKDCQKALAIIENSTPKPIDLISVNNRYVINVGGVGFDGHVAKQFNLAMSRGLIGYIKLILKELFTYKEFDFEVKSPDFSKKGKAFIIAIANGTEFGNRFKVAPAAHHNDGRINLIIIRKPPILKLLWLFVQGYRGKLKPSKYYQSHFVENAELSYTNSVTHVDGELDEENLSSPLQLKINKSALSVHY